MISAYSWGLHWFWCDSWCWAENTFHGNIHQLRRRLDQWVSKVLADAAIDSNKFRIESISASRIVLLKNCWHYQLDFHQMDPLYFLKCQWHNTKVKRGLKPMLCTTFQHTCARVVATFVCGDGQFLHLIWLHHTTCNECNPVFPCNRHHSHRSALLAAGALTKCWATSNYRHRWKTSPAKW